MRVARLVLSFLCVVLAFQPLRSQQITAVAQRDALAVDVLAQSLTAMGAIASPTRMTLAQGTATYPDGSSKAIKIETIGTDSVRQDIGTNEFSFVSSAGDGFLLLQGKKEKLQSWVTAYHRAEHLPALSLMADYLNPNLQIQYAGLEDIDGNPTHHLRLSVIPTDKTPPELADLMSEFHVWIDQKSLLALKTRHFDFSPEAIQNRTPVDIVYSDYRTEGGVTIPYHLTRYIATDKQLDVTFSTISLNASVSASDFQ